MRFAVFGAGSLGGCLGARLCHAGEDVALIARGEHLRAIQSKGLRLESQQGDYVVRPFVATDAPSQVGVVDAVVIGVKAWLVPEAAEAVKPMVGPQTVVVPVQNGVEAPFQLAAVLGKERVLGGAIQIVSALVGPGHIRQVTPNADLVIGELDNRRTARVDHLQQAFQRAGVSTIVPPDIQVAMWTKLLYIAGISGLAAVTRSPAGEWRSVPALHQMAEDAMRETLAVARARGIPLPDGVVQEQMAVVDRLPPEATTSMMRDILAGRPSELEFINGAVVRLGKEAGVPTPVNAFIYYSLLPQERRARGG